MGGTSSGDEGVDDQRARLLRMGNRMDESTCRLQQAHRTVLETENIGASILGDLRAQRDTLTHAAGKLRLAQPASQLTERLGAKPRELEEVAGAPLLPRLAQRLQMAQMRKDQNSNSKTETRDPAVLRRAFS